MNKCIAFWEVSELAYGVLSCPITKEIPVYQEENVNAWDSRMSGSASLYTVPSIDWSGDLSWLLKWDDPVLLVWAIIALGKGATPSLWRLLHILGGLQGKENKQSTHYPVSYFRTQELSLFLYCTTEHTCTQKHDLTNVLSYCMCSCFLLVLRVMLARVL